MLINLLAFVLVLGILVLLHEAGHFLAARAVGARVEVFSVGFGKRLWGVRRGGTDYRVSLIPLGGYVRVVGLGPDEGTDAEQAAQEELLPRWKRALILLAGPVTNVIAAVVFLAIAFVLGVNVPAYQDRPAVIGWVEPGSPAAAAGIQPGDTVVSVDGTTIETWRDLETAMLTAGGRTVTVALRRDGTSFQVSLTPKEVSRYGFGYAGILPPLSSEVRQVVPGSPAERAGLRPGDRIVAVNGQPVQQFYDLIRLISPHPGERVTLTVEREGGTVEIGVVPEDVGGEGKVGIALVFPSVLHREGPAGAVVTAVRECRRMTRETFRVLGKLITRKASVRQTMSGPIDIARISGRAARSGIRSLVWLLGVISLQLGIFNLLPIPVLDGGHLTVIAFETLIRRDLPPKVKERILEVGFILLILLMVVVIYNDILKILPESVYRFFHRTPTP